MPYRQFLREQQRNQRAVEAVRARQEQDPYEQARRRCRELQLPHSVAAAVDAIAEQHVKLGKDCRDAPVFIGYGDGTESEKRWRGRGHVERPRQPRQYPTLTERTGYSRRTMLRARKLIEGHEILSCRRDHGERIRGGRVESGAPRVRTYTCRSRKTGVVRGSLTHLVGLGGCDKGGRGLANAYRPWGVEDPDRPVPRGPVPQPDGRPAPRPGFGAQAWERAERERRARRAETRGP